MIGSYLVTSSRACSGVIPLTSVQNGGVSFLVFPISGMGTATMGFVLIPRVDLMLFRSFARSSMSFIFPL